MSTTPDRSGRVALHAILVPSPHRVAPACRHHGRAGSPPAAGWCGGCQWQHIAYPHQLRLKAELVDRLVRGAVADAPASGPTLPGARPDAPWGFRQKVHFLLGESGPPRRSHPVLGHYAAGSRRIVPITECPVHAPRGNELAFAFLDHLSGAALSPRTRRVLRGLAVRVAPHTGESMVTLVASEDGDRALRAVTRRFIAATAPTSTHLNLHDRDDGYVFGAHTRTLDGSAHITERIAGIDFSIAPTAFFQTNVGAADALVRLVVDVAGPPTTVADLYAGGGLFALPLARAGHTVVAVETHPDAVAAGIRAALTNGVPRTRCRFVESTVEQALGTIAATDVVILDPPREGCTRTVLQGVLQRVRPRLVLYVSCQPESLARDLGVLRAGYRIRQVQPVDMFPHTPHVETVVVLERRTTRSPA